MRFTLVVSGLFAALAVAQTTDSAPSPTVSVDPVQSSQAACLSKCPAGAVDCQAHCIYVPSPNQEQVNATTQCVAKCPQGNGSPAETKKYADCIDGCIANHFYVTSVGTPQPTGGKGNGDSGSDGSSATKTDGSGATGTKTGSAATGTHTNAATVMAGSGAALFGVVAAILAL